jgi:hypothetical protein
MFENQESLFIGGKLETIDDFGNRLTLTCTLAVRSTERARPWARGTHS